jgi:general secretion pathway protein G
MVWRSFLPNANRKDQAFTLIELLIILAIIGILISIALPQYGNLLNKSKQGATRGNLATLRSALSVYYGDNDQAYPADDLSCLTVNTRYLPLFPEATLAPSHVPTVVVATEQVPTDVGGWSYNNDSEDDQWGRISIGCLHRDLSGNLWTTY